MPSPFEPPYPAPPDPYGQPPNPYGQSPYGQPPPQGPFGAPNPYGQPPNPYGQPSQPGPFGAPNPYGQPPNPYQAPRFPDAGPVQVEEAQGSYGLGFAVGLLFAIIGLIIVYVAGKAETKRGAGHGFLLRIGINLLLFLLL